MKLKHRNLIAMALAAVGLLLLPLLLQGFGNAWVRIADMALLYVLLALGLILWLAMPACSIWAMWLFSPLVPTCTA